MPLSQHSMNDDFALAIDLDGPGGNAFAIIASVTRFLRATDQGDMVAAFIAKATTSGSYEKLLKLARLYAPVEFHRSGRPFKLSINLSLR
jgi:hypothetical protein